ncbi:hypothetical protein [Nonomuraea ceibae]|uniref:hypothetical protein n=1 Tax=Nonomuraea ceibae TaxID=1935170 RepID=UPI001C5F3BB7|nr:hypothetical protein [Nonomuraea ceibae]
MPKRAEPQISKTAGQRAITEIVDRRRQVRDPDLETLLRDVPEEQPVAVIRYVLASHRVPDWVTSNDVIDALWVLAYVRRYFPHLPEEADRLERDLLELGCAKQIAMIRMAPPLNVRTRQAVENRILRHRAAALGLARSERQERAHRLSAGRPAKITSAEGQWYDRHALSLWEAASELVGYRTRFDHLIDDELAESIIGLRRAVREMEWPLTQAHFPTLREIGWWAQEIVDALSEDRYADFRQQLGEVHPRLAELTAQQHQARFGSS